MKFEFEIPTKLPKRIDLPLDIAIMDLKKYKSELPFNLYSLSSREVSYLKRILAIIEGMQVPTRVTE